MKWNSLNRVVFLGIILIVAAGLCFLASYLSSDNISYNFTGRNFENWVDWNLRAYLGCAVANFLLFAVLMWWFGDRSAEYRKRKAKRASYTYVFGIVSLIFGLVVCFISGRINPFIESDMLLPYLWFLIIPAFLFFVMLACLVVNDKYGLVEW